MTREEAKKAMNGGRTLEELYEVAMKDIEAHPNNYNDIFEGYENNLDKAVALIEWQKQEIERLQSMNQAKLDMIHDIRAELETAKAEAIKEFAERLKGLLSLNVKVSNEDYLDISEDIDYLVETTTKEAGHEDNS